jgi:hypothetical protein
MATPRRPSTRWGLFAVVLGLLLLSRMCGSSSGSVKPTAEPDDIAQAMTTQACVPALATPTPPAAPQARTQWWKPGQRHDYGQDVDPFIHQPQDYASDTPARLGNRISYHVFDLELVQDMVRRGDEPGSEIAQVRGAPLTASERTEARRVLQQFFNETVPDVDAMIGGTLTTDDGYARIGPRRLALDRDLRAALALSEKQFAELWPHIPARDEMRARMSN